jgi:hypothetical protein
MNPQIIAVSIPIVGTFVLGLVLVVYFYLRSRERQMLIEKGLDAESIKKYFETKKDPNKLLKIGIVCIGFGIGLGLGLMLEDATSKEYYVPLCLFVATGIGFVAAGLAGRKLEQKNA